MGARALVVTRWWVGLHRLPRVVLRRLLGLLLFRRWALALGQADRGALLGPRVTGRVLANHGAGRSGGIHDRSRRGVEAEAGQIVRRIADAAADRTRHLHRVAIDDRAGG